VAFKWIRVLFACWKTNTPHDEKIYHRAFEGRARLSPLLNTELKWNSVAGFKKLALA
jgi:hypothetical protein